MPGVWDPIIMGSLCLICYLSLVDCLAHMSEICRYHTDLVPRKLFLNLGRSVSWVRVTDSH